jgi:predicted chitinase
MLTSSDVDELTRKLLSKHFAAITMRILLFITIAAVVGFIVATETEQRRAQPVRKPTTQRQRASVRRPAPRASVKRPSQRTPVRRPALKPISKGVGKTINRRYNTKPKVGGSVRRPTNKPRPRSRKPTIKPNRSRKPTRRPIKTIKPTRKPIKPTRKPKQSRKPTRKPTKKPRNGGRINGPVGGQQNGNGGIRGNQDGPQNGNQQSQPEPQPQPGPQPPAPKNPQQGNGVNVNINIGDISFGNGNSININSPRSEQPQPVDPQRPVDSDQPVDSQNPADPQPGNGVNVGVKTGDISIGNGNSININSPGTRPQFSIKNNGQQNQVDPQQGNGVNIGVKTGDISIANGNSININSNPKPEPSDTPQTEAPVDPNASVTAKQLKSIMKELTHEKVTEYLSEFNFALNEGKINTCLRKAAFLAQIAHESSQLKYWEEIAPGSAYEGRKDLGNDQVGDGVKYKGRGPLQLTGRANYAACGEAINLDLVNNPQWVSNVDVGFRAAQWLWNSKNLNEVSDTGDFKAVTQAINGGLHASLDRQRYYALAKNVLGC